MNFHNLTYNKYSLITKSSKPFFSSDLADADIEAFCKVTKPINRADSSAKILDETVRCETFLDV